MTRGWPAVLALVIAAVACNGAFRFDQMSHDGGGGDTGTVTCPDGGCGGYQVQGGCPEEECELTCLANASCMGRCNLTCDAVCEDGSQCTLIGGQGVHVTCVDTATCTFVVGANAVATCESGSNCDVQCTGACSLNCLATACQLQCGSAPVMTVSGLVTCP